jgi:hypothetical protein
MGCNRVCYLLLCIRDLYDAPAFCACGSDFDLAAPQQIPWFSFFLSRAGWNVMRCVLASHLANNNISRERERR